MIFFRETIRTIFLKTIMEKRVQFFGSNRLFHYYFPTSFVLKIHKTIQITSVRSSHPEVFLGEGVLKICTKFTGEHPFRSVISIKFLNYFIEITLEHFDFAAYFQNTFPKNTSRWLLLFGAFSYFLNMNSSMNA